MSEWRLFMPEDPETHPPLNKPLILCDFLGILRKPTPVEFTEKKGELYWSGGYIGQATKPMMWAFLPSMPKNPEIVEVKKCGLEGSCCEYEDDGYCFDPPEGHNCDKIKIAYDLKYSY